jgi:probable HAF family extracellular repeat protein
VGLFAADVAFATVEDCGAGGVLSVTFFGIDAPTEEDPLAVSGDGSTVVGGPDQNFRWNELGGFKFLSGGINDAAYDVSGDGSVVVGVADEILSPPEAFIWTSGTGIVGIASGSTSRALGVSADGSVVVGEIGIDAFRWTSTGGIMGLGHLPGAGFNSQANAISADGLTIVGTSTSTVFPFGEAFRWTSAGGMVGLGGLPGATASFALGVSADGSVVVGTSGLTPYEGFRWTSSGMVGLGTPVGFIESRAHSVSGDGSIIVGDLMPDGGGSEAAVWDATNGWRKVTDVLTLHGVSIGTWKLEGGVDISADGCTIVGRGLEPNTDREPWVVEFARVNVNPGPTPTPTLGLLASVMLALSLLAVLVRRTPLRWTASIRSGGPRAR